MAVFNIKKVNVVHKTDSGKWGVVCWKNNWYAVHLGNGIGVKPKSDTNDFTTAKALAEFRDSQECHA